MTKMAAAKAAVARLQPSTPLPNTAIARQMFSACVANGGAGWDHSGLVRALEIQAKPKIAERD